MNWPLSRLLQSSSGRICHNLKFQCYKRERAMQYISWSWSRSSAVNVELARLRMVEANGQSCVQPDQAMGQASASPTELLRAGLGFTNEGSERCTCFALGYCSGLEGFVTCVLRRQNELQRPVAALLKQIFGLPILIPLTTLTCESWPDAPPATLASCCARVLGAS